MSENNRAMLGRIRVCQALGTTQTRPVAQRRILPLAALWAVCFAAAPGSFARESSRIDSRKGVETGPPEAVASPQASSQLPAGQVQSQPSQRLLLTVVDETSVAISSAHATLEPAKPSAPRSGETDYAGRYEFTDLLPGTYQLRVEKEGYYAVVLRDVQIGETTNVEVTLNHVREYSEVVNVVYSPPSIDPQKVSDTKSLGDRELLNLPFLVTRDIRYALPLLPGVLQDATGQEHVNGSSTRQIQDQLDGFNITNPASGLFDVRVSVDALQSVEVYSSRYSTEYGKGSGGVVSLRTGIGDNHWRFSATDFFPSLQNRKGFHINTWTPRGILSGPIWKDKAWFLEAIDGDYSLNIINELPPGADQGSQWRIANFTKTQVNLTPANILTASFLVNRFGAHHAGLSRFNPLETTLNETASVYLLTVKDQVLFHSGLLMEAGLGLSEFLGGVRPLGQQAYVVRPESTSGNYFESGDGRSSRLQGIANLFLPPRHWNGRHEFKVGLDVDRLTDHQAFERRPVLILREDGTLSDRITFAASSSFSRNNFEAGGYAQDRWSPSDRWLVEPGVRLDWDEVVRDVLVAPRLATTYLLSRRGDTKLAGGAGLYYDASSLDLLARALSGQRLDYFYDASGQTLVRPPVPTTFQVNARELKGPRFLNWSVGLDRKMPHAIFLRAQFVQKRGWNGWTYINLGAPQPGEFSGQFALKNQRRDRYDALEISLRRTFKGNHVVFASFTRSAARSSAVLNFSLESLLFSQQAGGPLPWDTPNRFLSWAWLPLPWGFDLAYSLDWRGGYPFTLVNQDQQLVSTPGSRRFPTYFSLNLSLERRFTVLGFQWALRAGFDDITNRTNPSAVNSNVDSSQFLTFGGIQGRALIARIRFLGRK